MTRRELEHLIRAAASITDRFDFVIVGSQSILGQFPSPDEALTVSMEADMYVVDAPEMDWDINVNLGEGSQFHAEFGYYAEGVGVETAELPSDWMDRAFVIQNDHTNGRRGICPEAVDIFLSKAMAGRDQDRDFCVLLIELGYVDPAQALGRLGLMPYRGDTTEPLLRDRIKRWTKYAREPRNSV